MIDFDTYIKMGEPGGKERAEAWKTAIGLQAVDGLKTSEYLNETAAKHIEEDITIEQVQELIDTYYQSKTSRTPEDDEKEEADKAAANIAKIINEHRPHSPFMDLHLFTKEFLLGYSNMPVSCVTTKYLRKNGY